MDGIKGFFTKIWQAVMGFISGPGGRVIKQAIAAAIAEVGPAVFAVLLEVAEAKAKELEPISRMTGDEKFDQVKAIVEQAALRAGVEASKRLVNSIVEQAAMAAKGAE